MDAKTNIKARLPSRHVAERSARVLHRSHGNAMDPINEAVEVFKKTPCIPGLKLGGRYVAKDLFQVGGIPLPTTALLGYGLPHGNGITFTGRTIAENFKPVTPKPNQNVVYPAVTHPGGKAEKISYADA